MEVAMKICRGVFFCFLVSVIICSCTAGKREDDSRYVKKPYIQNLTHNSVVVMWETAEKESGYVEIDKKKVRAEKPSTLHEITVRGLSPQTSYTYTVPGGQGGTFTTFPSPGPYPFKIAVYGDTRTFPETHKKAASLIKKENPMFFIHTGDIVSDGSKRAQWNSECFGPLEGIVNDLCMFPVLGNHEKNSPYYFQYFSLPGGERWYSRNAGSAHIVFLDSNLTGKMLDKQTAWLENDLKADNSVWKIAVFHHPPFSSGNRGINGTIVDRFMPLFYTYGVQFMFHGHDHHYVRSMPIYDSKGRVLVSIVTGGGGAPLYSLRKRTFTAASAKTHHICSVTVTPDSINGRVIDLEGGVIDRFAYSKKSMKNYAENGVPLNRVVSDYIIESGLSVKANVKGPVMPNSIMQCSISIPPLYFSDLGCVVTWNREKTTWHVKPEKKKVTLNPDRETDITFSLDYWGSVYPAAVPKVMLVRGGKTYPVRSELILPPFREIHITEMNEYPVIDGDITGSEIRGLKKHSSFIKSDANTEADKKTVFHTGVFGKSIYIAVENMETDMDRIQADAERRDGKVREDDCNEFYFKIPDSEHCYRLIVNAEGQTYDARSGDSGWNGTWKAAGRKLKDRWNTEILIPLKVLDRDLGPGEDLTIRMNICRYSTVNGEYSQWSRTYGPGSRPEYFGTGIILRK